MSFLTDIRKGIFPQPVYEAHFTDGTVKRMTFWSQRGKPLDVVGGRWACTGLPSTKGKIFSHGFVEWNGERLAHDEAAMFVPGSSGAYKPVKRRANVARARAIITQLRADPSNLTADKLAELQDALAA